MPARRSYLCHGLLWLWLSCAPVPGLAQDSLAGVGADTIGEPIAQFRISGNVKTTREYILQQGELRVGQLITIEALRYALQELRDTDLFKDIRFQVERLENGEVMLHITVEEKRYWLLLPRLGRNSDGDIKSGFSLRMDNLQGAGQSLDLLVQQEQQANGDNSDELDFKYLLPNFNRHYDLSWKLDRIVTNTEVEGFANVETDDFFSFAVAREWHLAPFSVPITVEAAIALEKRSLDEPYPDSIEARNAGDFNRLRLSLIHDDLHRERYRRYGHYYALSLGQGFDWLGSDYESTITGFEIRSFNRLNLYDNFNYRFILQFSNNSPFDYPLYDIGGGSSIRGLEGNDQRGDARWFGNLEYVFAYRKHPGLAHTLFLDLGNVYDHLEAIDITDFHYTVGTGFRWKVESFVKTNLFLEYGYDVENQQGKLYGGTSLNF